MMIKLAWSEDGEVQIQLFERSTVHGLTIEEAKRLEHDLKLAIKEAEEDPEFQKWWGTLDKVSATMKIVGVGIVMSKEHALPVWNAAKGRR